MSTPAEELRAAAATLHDRAYGAWAGPWTASKAPREAWPYTAMVACAGDDPHGRIADVWCGAGEENAAWMALMHPGLAVPLADLLDAIADDMDAWEDGVVEGSASKKVHPVSPLGVGLSPARADWTAALATARAINGGTP